MFDSSSLTLKLLWVSIRSAETVYKPKPRSSLCSRGIFLQKRLPLEHDAYAPHEQVLQIVDVLGRF